MPRRSRIDAPGALHHVMVRGIDRKDIFSDQKDYAAFMVRLGDLLIETMTSWVGYGTYFKISIGLKATTTKAVEHRS